MKQKKQKEPEMGALTVLFVLLCASVLLGIVFPGGTELAGYCYALIAIWGVVTCARSKAFMSVEVLVDLYPQGLRKGVEWIRGILMLLVFFVLFVIGILGVISQIQNPTASETLGIPNLILYVMPVVVYPIAILLYFKAMKKEEK